MKTVTFIPPYRNEGTTIVDSKGQVVLTLRTEVQAKSYVYDFNKDDSDNSSTDSTLFCEKYNKEDFSKSLSELAKARSIEEKDSVVKDVRKDLLDRSNVGIKKYNTTLDRKDIDLKGWLQHAYEEMLDGALYLKRAIKDIEESE